MFPSPQVDFGYDVSDYQAVDPRWRNLKVEKAMFDVARSWFDRGTYGFRLHAVDTMFENPQLRDNPTLPEKDAYGDQRQQRIYNVILPEVHAALQRLRRVVDRYPGRVASVQWRLGIGEPERSQCARLSEGLAEEDRARTFEHEHSVREALLSGCRSEAGAGVLLARGARQEASAVSLEPFGVFIAEVERAAAP